MKHRRTVCVRGPLGRVEGQRRPLAPVLRNCDHGSERVDEPDPSANAGYSPYAGLRSLAGQGGDRETPTRPARQFESEAMEVYEANPKVGNIRNNGPAMMRAAAKAAEDGTLPL